MACSSIAAKTRFCERIERRLAAMVRWPYENGEGLQVLRYRHGAQYVPHYDYFDPAQPGTPRILQRGGQRVGTIVMYLRTPERGGATIFPMLASKSRRSRVQRCSSAMTARIPIRRRCTAARQSHWAKNTSRPSGCARASSSGRTSTARRGRLASSASVKSTRAAVRHPPPYRPAPALDDLAAFHHHVLVRGSAAKS